MSQECYVLLWNADTGRRNLLVAVADDPERLNLEMSRYTAKDQARMHIENGDRLEDGD